MSDEQQHEHDESPHLLVGEPVEADHDLDLADFEIGDYPGDEVDVP